MYNTFSRNNSSHEDWKIVDKFDSAYWSGLDVQIYFNKILVSEAIQLSYMISEQVRPYFGYASYTANRIHHGARIVQGEVSLNYKRDGYLFSILQHIREQDDDDIFFKDKNQKGVSDFRVPIDYSNIDLFEQVKTQGLPADIANSMVSKSKATQEDTVYRSEAVVNQRAGIFETKLNGFDINIVFGAHLDSSKTLRWMDDDRYEIESAYLGDSWIVQEESGPVASTGLKISGVSIAGIAKTINDDGRPLIETYSFQAKDVVVLKNIDSGTPTSRNSTNVLKSPVKSKDGLDSKNSNGQVGNGTTDILRVVEDALNLHRTGN